MTDTDTLLAVGAGVVALVFFLGRGGASVVGGNGMMDRIASGTSSGTATGPSGGGGFDSTNFEQAQVESAQTTISAIEQDLIDPVSIPGGTTLDDASAYIGHSGL